MTDLNLSSLLGLTETEAVDRIKSAGLKARIRSRDGQGLMGTCDYRVDRINLHINQNKVTKATVG